jgi:hypothetical protein
MPSALKKTGECVKWKWPSFSLKSILVVSGVYAALGFWASSYLEADDALGVLAGSLVLGWCLLCWRFVRLNRERFSIAKFIDKYRSTPDEPPQSRK